MKKMVVSIIFIAVFLCLDLFPAILYAQHHGGFHGGGFRGGYHVGGPRVFIGGFFGFPHFYPYRYPYYYPRPYPYGYSYSYPEPYTHAAPPVNIEPQQTYYWYYCRDPQGYYPYVANCPGGWARVIPTPPPPGKDVAVR